MAGRDIVCSATHFWTTTLWQRPHHIMSRLSANNRVVYLRPMNILALIKFKEARAEYKMLSSYNENLHIFMPLIFPYGNRFPFITKINDFLVTLQTKRLIAKLGFKKPLLWFYSPMGKYLIGKLDESLVVYDCMDEHAEFRFADNRLERYEIELMNSADLVFTGGRSLYNRKKKFHHNTHLFPSSVDNNHFRLAMLKETLVPESVSSLKRPVIGYIGAVDERIDYDLLADLAERRKDWSFAVVGPVVKVKKRDLPKRANIHYLGKADYSQLPGYLKGFDAGLIPFKQNNLTKMLSPTKTLEYFSAGCAVASTPIPDMESDFAGLVHFGESADELIEAIEKALKTDRHRLREAALCHSWDNTVDSMRDLIRKALEGKSGQ
jgi:UDP-galactopyranose mutase